MSDSLEHLIPHVVQDIVIDILLGRGLHAAHSRHLIARGMATGAGLVISAGTAAFLAGYMGANALKCSMQCR